MIRVRGLFRMLHILPNGELLTRERREAEARRLAIKEERRVKLIEAQKIAEKVRSGDKDAPMSLDAYMGAVGFTRDEQHEMRGRMDREDK